MQKRLFFIVVAALIGAGCGSQVEVSESETPTATGVTSTPTPSALQAPPPSQTPLPLPASPMAPRATPAQGMTSTQVNVRAEPSTAGAVLGIILANSTVEIIGKDPGGNWWQILYADGPEGTGWVAAEFITTASAPDVPVIGGGTSAEFAIAAIVQQQVNVRSGPGTGFNSLGTLNAGDVVSLTGRDASGAWLQFDFASGPDGRGWVSAAFVQGTGLEGLPIVAEGNVTVGTGTPTSVLPSAEPTVRPALADGDSADSPGVHVALASSGTRSFQYSSDVSSPEGDAEDWVQFTTFTPYLTIELQCAGSGSYVAELLQNGSVVQNLVCGKIVLVAVATDALYAIHFQSAPAGGLQYTRFTVRVEGIR